MERGEANAWRRIFYRIFALCMMIPAVQFAPAPVYAAGKLAVSPMSLDCGVVEEGVTAIMQVQIENVGDSEVLIQNVRTN